MSPFPRLTRRGFLGAAGAGAAGIAAGAGGFAVAEAVTSTSTAPDDSYEFFGDHQAGIVTPAQDRLHFVAFDINPKATKVQVVAMLKAWTEAAARLTQGKEAGTIGAADGPQQAPPDDTGEALGLPASGLTITVGFGAGLFNGPDGGDRFGLAAYRPAALEDIPPFAGEQLDPTISGGDLCVQACAHDPQVAVHAIRNLARIGMGTVSVRWSQLGFGRTSSTSRTQDTPRNLFGFKDGTNNLKSEDGEQLDEQLWVGSEDQPWMAGGSYLVTRKIRMRVEIWDRTTLFEQEQFTGRHKGTGAPLGKSAEFDTLDLSAPEISPTSHVALAHPDSNGGAVLLRRGYNFVDGSDGLGRLDAGLFFMAYQRDPRTHFVPVQRRLANHDGLNEYLVHVSSGLFAIPPGVRRGGYVGDQLFT